MGHKNYKGMTLITLIIGFMLAIQFQTVKEPVIRDTRDTWELRQDLVKEKELYLNLLKEVRSNEEKLQQYRSEKSQSKEKVLVNTLNELKEEAGMTNITGPGIVIKIEPADEEVLLNKKVTAISPYLLKKLVNELNQFGALHISIQDQRLVNSSVIRDINGVTKIDGYPLNSLPIIVKITVDKMNSAEQIYKQMQVSKSAEDFYIENYRLTISEPQRNVKIPAYKKEITIPNMEIAKEKEGG